MRSIERYLLAWIMGALTLGAVLMALVVYLVTLEEMDEVFNANLKNVAQAVLSYHHSGHGPQADGTPAPPLRADTPDGSEIVGHVPQMSLFGRQESQSLPTLGE